MSVHNSVEVASRAIFRPLNFQRREIRLVELEPSTFINSPVICRLTVVTLSSRPTFEALSWCWGDPNEREEINLEGQKWDAPQHLVEALRNLRYPDRVRTIWVDALSINQAGYHEATVEKTQQIQLMKYIYSLASMTTIWMGNPPDDMADFLLTSLVDGRTLEHTLRSNPEDTMAYMVNVLLLSWWRRVWVVQEAVLAKNAVLRFGHLSVSLNHLLAEFRTFEQHLDFSMLGAEIHKILVLLCQETTNVFSHLIGSFADLPVMHRQALALAQMGRYQSTVVANRAKPFYALTEVLVQCRYFQTTDVRDKIWGFLGLCTDAVSQKLDPGYELSVAKIYAETTRKLIHSSGSLYILSQSQPGKVVLGRLPSWVPDWTMPRIDGDPHEWNHGPSREDREYIFDASSGQAAKNPESGWTPDPCKHVAVSDMDSVLPLQGLRFNYVKQVYHELGHCTNIYDWWIKTKAWRNAYVSSRNVKEPSGQTGFRSRFRSKEAQQKALQDEWDTYEFYLRVYWDLMMQGTMPRTWRSDMYVEQPQQTQQSVSQENTYIARANIGNLYVPPTNHENMYYSTTDHEHKGTISSSDYENTYDPPSTYENMYAPSTGYGSTSYQPSTYENMYAPSAGYEHTAAPSSSYENTHAPPYDGWDGWEYGNRYESEGEEDEDEDDTVSVCKPTATNRFGSIKHRSGQLVDGQVVSVSIAVLDECRQWGMAMDKGETFQTWLDLDELFTHLQKTTVGRRFFIASAMHTSDAPVGLGPASLQKLDEIWVMAGGSHPLALRAHGREPLNPDRSITGDKEKYRDMRFSLVGELYLSGLLSGGPMYGGIVEAASGDREQSYWVPQKRANPYWWPPDLHMSKKGINLNDYWWTAWLY